MTAGIRVEAAPARFRHEKDDGIIKDPSCGANCGLGFSAKTLYTASRLPRRRPKDRTSMRNGVTLGLLLLGSPSLLASGGCTRTYDGSLVPAYALSSSHSAMNIPVGIVRADPLPPDRLYRFPPAPPPPPGEIENVTDPAPSRSAGLAIGGFIPRIETEAPRPVTCRNESADGRIRFVCD